MTRKCVRKFRQYFISLGVEGKYAIRKEDIRIYFATKKLPKSYSMSLS